MSIDSELDQAMELGREVVTRQQQDRDPTHEDFYLWGSALSELTIRLQDAAQTLGRQVAPHGDRRILRDDEGANPATRLAERGPTSTRWRARWDRPTTQRGTITPPSGTSPSRRRTGPAMWSDRSRSGVDPAHWFSSGVGGGR